MLEVGARCIGQASRSTEISSTAFAARPSGDVGLPVIASSAIDLSSRRGIISPAGVLSGLAAGCHVIAVNAPADTPRLNEVDLVLHSLEQITVTKQPNGDVIIQ